MVTRRIATFVLNPSPGHLECAKLLLKAPETSMSTRRLRVRIRTCVQLMEEKEHPAALGREHGQVQLRRVAAAESKGPRQPTKQQGH